MRSNNYLRSMTQWLPTAASGKVEVSYWSISNSGRSNGRTKPTGQILRVEVGTVTSRASNAGSQTCRLCVCVWCSLLHKTRWIHPSICSPWVGASSWKINFIILITKNSAINIGLIVLPFKKKKKSLQILGNR